jgi:nucleotide-binding universal stress UspA family protein
VSALAKQEKIDLVVMGTIARSGLHGALMGNTAEQVLDQIESAVLAIKPENFHSLVIRDDDPA